MRDEETGDGTQPRRELTVGEVTKRLKISHQALYRLVHDHSVPLRREGIRILWDEAAVSAVSELVRQREARQASEKQVSETQAEFKELGTQAVCRKRKHGPFSRHVASSEASRRTFTYHRVFYRSVSSSPPRYRAFHSSLNVR